MIRHPRFFRPPRVLLFLLAPLVVLAAGCIESVTPDGVTNVVGQSHTVTATINEERTQSVLGQSVIVRPQQLEGAPTVLFEILSGPNAGKHSTDDCQPGCEIEPESTTISWTYVGTGGAGTDVIRVCTVEEGTTIEETLADFEESLAEEQITVEDFLAEVNDVLGTNFTSLEDLFCDTVTKIWVRPTPVPQPTEVRRVNVGGAVGAVVAAAGAEERDRQKTPLAAAAQAPSISAPNTG
ncbi:MAG TPA: hypothetical protein VH951_07005, partial [Dehalococcoidia bacterium]